MAHRFERDEHDLLRGIPAADGLDREPGLTRSAWPGETDQPGRPEQFREFRQFVLTPDKARVRHCHRPARRGLPRWGGLVGWFGLGGWGGLGGWFGLGGRDPGLELSQ